MTEQWRPVSGYDGRYEVSDLGRVRSLLRLSVVGKPWEPNSPPRLLAAREANCGYAVVTLCNGRAVSPPLLVHRLVLEAFGGRPTAGQVVRHKNGERLDNRLENLEYGTLVENERDKFRHGTRPLGSRAPQSKLKEHQVLEIRRRADAGDNRQRLAREFGVSDNLITQIARRKVWAWLPEEAANVNQEAQP